MRPRLLCPGKQSSCRVAGIPVRPASMRPRLLCPGKLHPGSRHAGRILASMRPRLLCPGKPALPNPPPTKANFTSFRAPLPFARIPGREGGCHFLHHVKAQQYQYLTRIREPLGSCAPRSRSQPIQRNQADSVIIPQPHAFRYRKRSCRCSRSPISSSPPARCRSAGRGPRPL